MKIIKDIKRIVGSVIEDELTVFAAQASYYIIISAFPFAMLFLSLVGFIFPMEKEGLNLTIQAFFPSSVSGFLDMITEELFEKSIPIVSITALTTFWTASRGIASVERGVRRVYQTPKESNFIKAILFSLMYTVMFIGILILTLGLQVFGNTILNVIEEHIVFSRADIIFVKGFLLFIMMTLIFQIMYYCFGRRIIPFMKNLPGAIFSSAGWMIFSKIFSVYIDNFADYSFIYGSITAVVLCMLWLYFCVIILLSGAELNSFIYQYGKNKK